LSEREEIGSKIGENTLVFVIEEFQEEFEGEIDKLQMSTSPRILNEAIFFK
jgi:hypothetical protein